MSNYLLDNVKKHLYRPVYPVLHTNKKTANFGLPFFYPYVKALIPNS